MALTDENGVVKASYSYDAWGNTLSSTSSATTGDGEALNLANPFRYSSYYFDETSGLYYLNARYYSPELGRFLSKDPVPGAVGAPLSSNRFTYAINNPVNLSDPDGSTPLALAIPMGGSLAALAEAIGVGAMTVLTGPVGLAALIGVGTVAIGTSVYRMSRAQAKAKPRDITVDIPRTAPGRTGYYIARRNWGDGPPITLGLEISLTEAVALMSRKDYREGVWTFGLTDAQELAKAVAKKGSIYSVTAREKGVGEQQHIHVSPLPGHYWFGVIYA